MTKKELLVIHEHVKKAINEVYISHQPKLQYETFATAIIEEIELDIQQLFVELQEELEKLPNTVGIPKCFETRQMKGKQIL